MGSVPNPKTKLVNKMWIKVKLTHLEKTIWTPVWWWAKY